MTAAGDPQIVPQSLPSAPALRAADRGVADALESVLSENTRRVYGAQWRLFTDWCDSVDLRSLPSDPLTVARYLAARANSGASNAAPGHQRDRQSSRVGRPRVPRPGPRRARGAEGLEPTFGQAPAPGRRPHRRRVSPNPPMDTD